MPPLRFCSPLDPKTFHPLHSEGGGVDDAGLEYQRRYYLYVRNHDVIGPHPLDRLREWLDLGAISPGTLVCMEGEQNWAPISKIPKVDFIPDKVRERVERRRARMRLNWWSEAVTETQLAKLRYFEIAFDEASLNKARAAELIDSFAAIDPDREAEYRIRFAADERMTTLWSPGADQHPEEHPDGARSYGT